MPAASVALLVVVWLCFPATAQDWTADWLHRVSQTQAEQPHWITPVAVVTPRLEQELRYDIVHQQTASGDVTNLGNGKGLEIIPSHNIELLFNIPPYLVHENPHVVNGWGDTSFVLKYRLASRNEEHGNYIVTAFLAGSVPTGTYKNGAVSAIVTPTIAAGKGWRKLDVQSTLGAGLPVDDVQRLGRTVLSNTAAQYHAARFLWPEVELNATFWHGGANDGKRQAFVTPGIVFGRFPVHHRIGVTIGAGVQIAATHFHQYNHAAIFTFRLPF